MGITPRIARSDKMENHEIAKCYPPLNKEEFEALKAHIAANGLQNPIVLYEGKILDGTQRAGACTELGIEPHYITPQIADPFDYVIGQNERRRQLTQSQLAAVAEEMANLKHGWNRYAEKVESPAGDSIKSRAYVAKKLGIGTTTVDKVRYAKKHGIPELVPAVKSGKLSVTAAEQIAHLEKSEQPKAFEAAVAKGPKKRKAKTANSEAGKTPQPHLNARLSPDRIAECEAKTKTESIYPEGLPFPVHPQPGLTAHLHEAFVALKDAEPLIPQMSRRQLYDEVWVYTQRIQTFAPGFGKDAYIIKDIDPRWTEWAGNVARKVRAQETLLLEKQQTEGNSPNGGQEKKARRQFADAFEKRMKNWRRLIKRALNETHFALEEEVRVFEATEYILIDHFEERRARSARRAPSKTGEPNPIADINSAAMNGSPSLQGEQ
jgi:hypothetical protein